MRDTIIFSGQSNTFGLGLEWELDPELNSEEYLSKGIILPNHMPRHERNQQYWRKYRWPKLVCDALGYKEYNVHDKENGAIMGGGAADTLWHILDRYEHLMHILDKTKYLVLEIGFQRWWDESLHGQPGGDKLPNTPIEIENYLNSKNPDIEVVKKAIDWIGRNDQKYFWKQTFNKVKLFSGKFPEIKIVLVPWSGASGNNGIRDFENYDDLTKFVSNCFVDIENYPCIHELLLKEKLMVLHKAKAFNGDYKYNYADNHASVEGHKRVAELVIKHIKKLENDKKE